MNDVNMAPTGGGGGLREIAADGANEVAGNAEGPGRVRRLEQRVGDADAEGAAVKRTGPAGKAGPGTCGSDEEGEREVADRAAQHGCSQPVVSYLYPMIQSILG